MPVLVNLQQMDAHTWPFYLTLSCTRSVRLTEPSQIFLSVSGLSVNRRTVGVWGTKANSSTDRKDSHPDRRVRFVRGTGDLISVLSNRCSIPKCMLKPG